MAPANQCVNCGEDFSSLRLFDKHITSAASAPTFSCLSIAEMVEQGWEKDTRGRWFDPVKVERAREAFAKAA